jgi:hypothetical protein
MNISIKTIKKTVRMIQMDNNDVCNLIVKALQVEGKLTAEEAKVADVDFDCAGNSMREAVLTVEHVTTD